MAKQHIDNYSYHEVLDRTHIIIYQINDLLLKHPLILQKPKWNKKAERALEILSTLYQDVGSIDYDEVKDSQPAKLFINEAKARQPSPPIYKWLLEHPLINVNGLCKEAGIDRSNFVKQMEAEKEPKPEIKKKIIKIISKYGYQ